MSGVVIFHRGVLLIITILFCMSGGISAAGLSETVCRDHERAGESTELTVSANVMNYFGFVLLDASELPNHRTNQPCSEPCHHCHGHFSHVPLLENTPLVAAGYAAVDATASSLYLRCLLDRARTPLFRPPIFT